MHSLSISFISSGKSLISISSSPEPISIRGLSIQGRSFLKASIPFSISSVNLRPKISQSSLI